MGNSYSFLDVTASMIGPTGVIDLGAGSANGSEGISVSFAGAKNTMTVGIDGEGMHSLSPNKSGTISISLLKTSPVNKKLSLAYNAQSHSSTLWGNNVIVIRNSTSGDVVTARGVAFQKVPDFSNAAAAGDVIWTFDCLKLDSTLGEF